MAVARSIGNVTGDQKPWTPGYVNLMDLGATGDGVADDTAFLQEAVASGTNIYVPGGYRFRCTAPLVLSSRNNVRIFGDGKSSRIEMATEDARLFDVQNCNGIEICDLRLTGPTIVNGVHPGEPAGGRGSGSPIYGLDNVDIQIENVWFEGWPADVIYLRHVLGLRVRGNTFEQCDSDGNWGAAADAIGVYNQSNTPDGNPDSRDIIITDNRIWSQSDTGISCGFRAVRRAIIANNIIIPKDNAGNEIRPNNMRHNIVVSYHDYQQADTEGYTIQVHDNQCHNPGWANIYLNGTSTSTTNPGKGFKGVLHDNICVGWGHREEGDANQRGGIAILSCTDLDIHDNVMRNGTDPDSQAINCQSFPDGTLINIHHNTFRNVAAQLIYLGKQSSDTIVDANNAYDFQKEFVAVFGTSARSGKLSIINNRVVRLGGEVDRIINVNHNGTTAEDGAEVIFQGNYLEQVAQLSQTGREFCLFRTWKINASGNTLVGPGSAQPNSLFAMRFTLAPAGRVHGTIIDNNKIVGFHQGLTMSGGTAQSGPILAINNEMVDVAQPINSQVIWAGKSRGSTSSGTPTYHAYTSSTSPPSNGSWSSGDEVTYVPPSPNTAIGSGQAMRWRCKEGGLNPVWVVEDTMT